MSKSLLSREHQRHTGLAPDFRWDVGRRVGGGEVGKSVDGWHSFLLSEGHGEGICCSEVEVPHLSRSQVRDGGPGL